MKIIISASRQNGQKVFYTSKHHNPITEYQSLAFDFSVCNEPQKSADDTIKLMRKEYTGLSNWKIEEVKE